jgi:hypothetical protein
MICEICKKEFIQSHFNQKFCSDKCLNSHLVLYRKNYNKNNNDKHSKYHKEWRINNKERDKQNSMNRNKRIKIEVMSYYCKGIPYCQCCKENIVKFLTIDHVDNNGSKHRKSLGLIGGIKFYYWLKNNNYPKGYQVLCYNCNCGRDKNHGICPHKEGIK